MNVKAEKFEKARVNGGSNYDSLKKEKPGNSGKMTKYRTRGATLERDSWGVIVLPLCQLVDRSMGCR